MKKQIIFWSLLISLLGVSFCANDYAPSIGEIKAYPNPFSPQQNKPLQIKLVNGNFEAGSTVLLKIYDINGVQVYRKSFSDTAVPEVKWSGYLQDGKRTPPGVYTIQLNITLKDFQSRSGKTKLIIK